MRIRALVLSAGCLALAAAAGGGVGVGDRFPSLSGAGLAGAALPQTTGKVVLVDFWASWCAPCKASFPAYSRLDSEFASRGLVIVAVSVDEDAGSYDSFVRRLHPSFFVARDAGHGLVREAQVPTMPTSYLQDRDGRIRYVHAGFHGAETEQALRREIMLLLAEKPHE